MSRNLIFILIWIISLNLINSGKTPNKKSAVSPKYISKTKKPASGDSLLYNPFLNAIAVQSKVIKFNPPPSKNLTSKNSLKLSNTKINKNRAIYGPIQTSIKTSPKYSPTTTKPSMGSNSRSINRGISGVKPEIRLPKSSTTIKTTIKPKTTITRFPNTFKSTIRTTSTTEPEFETTLEESTEIIQDTTKVDFETSTQFIDETSKIPDFTSNTPISSEITIAEVDRSTTSPILSSTNEVESTTPQITPIILTTLPTEASTTISTTTTTAPPPEIIVTRKFITLIPSFDQRRKMLLMQRGLASYGEEYQNVQENPRPAPFLPPPPPPPQNNFVESNPYQNNPQIDMNYRQQREPDMADHHSFKSMSQISNPGSMDLAPTPQIPVYSNNPMVQVFPTGGANYQMAQRIEPREQIESPQEIRNFDQNSNYIPPRYHDGSGSQYQPESTKQELPRAYSNMEMDWGCYNYIFFGNDLWTIQGKEYCEFLSCENHWGNNPEPPYCTSVTMSNRTAPHLSGMNTVYTVNCKCPELGHTAPPTCKDRLEIGFKLIPRTFHIECHHAYESCGGGKYCFLAKGKIQCPSTCILPTSYKGGMITVRIQYNCCKNL